MDEQSLSRHVELDRQVSAKYATTVAFADYREYVKVGKQENFSGDVEIKKHGAEFSLEPSDDIENMAERLAMAAIRTESRNATTLFVSESGPSPLLFGNPIGDVTNLWRGTGATLNATNLQNAASAMSEFERLDLVVPLALRDGMEKAIASVGDARITGHVNTFISVIDRSEFADVTWYLFGRKEEDAAVCLNFLEGHESPEVCISADNPGKFRIRHLVGGAQRNPRCARAFIGVPVLS